MASNQLSAIRVEKITEPGRYADGQGLYLEVKASGSKRWFFRYQLSGKRRDMGLGNYHKRENTLSDARHAAAEKRLLIRQGIDPIDHAKQEKERRRREQEQELRELQELQSQELATFKTVAEEYIKTKSLEWKNEKHKAQWGSTLETYVYAFIGDMPVNDVELADIRKVLDPIWPTKTETASRVRQRIESVLSSAIAAGIRTKSNPAVWKGMLENFYAQPDKLKRKRHIEAGTNELLLPCLMRTCRHLWLSCSSKTVSRQWRCGF
jgi:hypothetical protein